MDTIFAKSSGSGKAGVAIYRISGPSSLKIATFLIKNFKQPLAGVMHFKKIYSPENDELIDEGFIVYFKSPNSFTGEDVIELHLHGSIAIEKILTRALLSTKLVRIANAGEFAKRAFLNEKFDLTAAEGLADLIDAETSIQHKQAIKQKSGELEKLYGNWRGKLIKIISLLEAYLDFPDEDIPAEVLAESSKIIDDLKSDIKMHLNDNRRGQRLREGIKLAILGKPNSGKSTLMNFLMQKDASIISQIPGTTRDIIEGHLDIAGYPIIIQDTAGIRESFDEIEQEGVKRSRKAATDADIKIIITEHPNENIILNEFNEYIDDYTILVVNKIDLLQNNYLLENNKYIYISLHSKIGLEKLIDKIILIAEKLGGVGESAVITRERYRQRLTSALEALESFNLNNNDLVLATEDVRSALRYLSNIIGIITPEEILGEIFSNFCIGK